MLAVIAWLRLIWLKVCRVRGGKQRQHQALNVHPCDFHLDFLSSGRCFYRQPLLLRFVHFDPKLVFTKVSYSANFQIFIFPPRF